MADNHVRVQICRHFANLLYVETEVPCDIHRQTIIPIESDERLDVSITDEATQGDNAANEWENTMGTQTRNAPLVVEVTVKGAGAYIRAQNLSGEVERAMAGEDLDGDHLISAGVVTAQYTGAAGNPEYDDTEQTEYTVQLLFTCSYRTPIGDPFTLI